MSSYIQPDPFAAAIYFMFFAESVENDMAQRRHTMRTVSVCLPEVPLFLCIGGANQILADMLDSTL